MAIAAAALVGERRGSGVAAEWRCGGGGVATGGGGGSVDKLRTVLVGSLGRPCSSYDFDPGGSFEAGPLTQSPSRPSQEAGPLSAESQKGL